MNRVLVVCRQRLGDIVACFPAARLLTEAGNEVDFCCFPQYHPIFRAITYCRPVGPEILGRTKDYDRVYDLEIRRSEYDAFRAARTKIRHYMYAKYPDLWAARDLLPHFDQIPEISDYGLPARYALACPTGISQTPKVDGEWFRHQCLPLSPDPWYVLTDQAGSRTSWGIPLHAKSLDHLPALIARATTFVTINSAPNIIAAGVRTSWYQVYEAGFGGQSNYDAPGQIVLHQPPEKAHYSWRFWVHYWRRRLRGIDVTDDFGK